MHRPLFKICTIIRARAKSIGLFYPCRRPLKWRFYYKTIILHPSLGSLSTPSKPLLKNQNT